MNYSPFLRITLIYRGIPGIFTGAPKLKSFFPISTRDLFVSSLADVILYLLRSLGSGSGLVSFSIVLAAAVPVVLTLSK